MSVISVAESAEPASDSAPLSPAISPRTRLLLHLVDLMDDDLVHRVRVIAAELKKYDAALHRKPRWLVFNKTDAVNDAKARAEKTVRALRWKHPWFAISALSGEGCDALSKAIVRELAS